MKIRTQVFYISFSACLLPLLVMSFLIFSFLEREALEGEHEKFNLIFSKVELLLNERLGDLDSKFDTLSDIISEHDKEEVEEYLNYFSHHSDEIQYFAYVDGEGNIICNEDPHIISNHTYMDKDWYKKALASPGSVISEVFTSKITRQSSIIVSKRLHGQNHHEGSDAGEGVIWAELNLDILEESLHDMDLENISDLFIVDRHGDPLITVISEDASHEEEEHEIHSFEDNIDLLIEKGSLKIEEHGKTMLHYYRYLDSLDLYLIIGIFEDKLRAPIYEMEKIIVSLTVMTLIFSSILISIFSKKLSSSLKRLSYIIDNIARGNYTKNIQKLTEVIDVDNELHLVKEAIKKMQEEIQEREARLKMISEMDPLTQVYNKGAISDLIRIEAHRSNSFGTEFSLIMFDLDHFKNLNDTHGHLFGDQVLQRIAQSVGKTLKKSDIIGRYGGEEFLILLPDTDLGGGIATARRVKHIIASLEWEYPVTVTASFGVIQNHQINELTTLISSVDGLLYRAKKNGRNRVEFHTERSG